MNSSREESSAVRRVWLMRVNNEREDFFSRCKPLTKMVRG
jgi:hypothetical protein